MPKRDQAEAGRPLQDVAQLVADTKELVQKFDGTVDKLDHVIDKSDSIVSGLISGKLRIRTSVKFRPLGIDVWLEQRKH